MIKLQFTPKDDAGKKVDGLLVHAKLEVDDIVVADGLSYMTERIDKDQNSLTITLRRHPFVL